MNKLVDYFIKLLKLNKYFNLNKKSFSKLNYDYYAEFNMLADNAYSMRKSYRRKIEKIIFRRYKKDYRTLYKIEKDKRIEL